MTREPWLRLTVAVRSPAGKKFIMVDVGREELASLIFQYGPVEVMGWGRYSEGCYAHQSEEHKKILELLEKVTK